MAELEALLAHSGFIKEDHLATSLVDTILFDGTVDFLVGHLQLIVEGSRGVETLRLGQGLSVGHLGQGLSVGQDCGNDFRVTRACLARRRIQIFRASRLSRVSTFLNLVLDASHVDPSKGCHVGCTLLSLVSSLGWLNQVYIAIHLTIDAAEDWTVHVHLTWPAVFGVTASILILGIVAELFLVVRHVVVLDKGLLACLNLQI